MSETKILRIVADTFKSGKLSFDSASLLVDRKTRGKILDTREHAALAALDVAIERGTITAEKGARELVGVVSNAGPDGVGARLKLGLITSMQAVGIDLLAVAACLGLFVGSPDAETMRTAINVGAHALVFGAPLAAVVGAAYGTFFRD